MPLPAACVVAPPSVRPGPVRQPRDLSPLTVDRQATGTAETPVAEAAAATAGAGGALQFELTAHGGGVHVMRVHRHDDGAKVYCSLLFDDERLFLDWLDADAMRFIHPLAFQQARRCFAQLMARRGGHDSVRR